VFNAGHSFFAALGRRVFQLLIIFVDRLFTSFSEGAFTSISDARVEIAAIACLFHRRHAD
jgi:hypothetical protein